MKTLEKPTNVPTHKNKSLPADYVSLKADNAHELDIASLKTDNARHELNIASLNRRFDSLMLPIIAGQVTQNLCIRRDMSKKEKRFKDQDFNFGLLNLLSLCD